MVPRAVTPGTRTIITPRTTRGRPIAVETTYRAERGITDMRRLPVAGSAQDPNGKRNKGLYAPEPEYSVRARVESGKALPKQQREYRAPVARPSRGTTPGAEVARCALDLLANLPSLNDPAHKAQAVRGYTNPRALAEALNCVGIAMQCGGVVVCSGDLDMRWSKYEWSSLCSAVAAGEFHVQDRDLVVEVA
jgi:hypothetical protein